MIVSKAGIRLFLCALLVLILSAETGFASFLVTPQPEKRETILRKKSLRKTSTADAGYHLMELSYLTLNAIDLATTFYSLDNGAREVNPIARTFIDNRPLAVALKGGLTLTVLYGLRQVKKQNKGAAYFTLALLNGFYSYVVTNNMIVSFQVSR